MLTVAVSRCRLYLPGMILSSIELEGDKQAKDYNIESGSVIYLVRLPSCQEAC